MGAYLAIYNLLLFAGWSQILYSAVFALYTKGPPGVYDAVEKPLQIWQTPALLEIFNSIVGITRSPVMAMLPEIASRVSITRATIQFIFVQAFGVRDHWLVTSLILSWGIREVIRYSFFGLKEVFGSAPRFLLWPAKLAIFASANPLLLWLTPKGPRGPTWASYLSSTLGSPGMYSHMIHLRKKALAVKPKET